MITLLDWVDRAAQAGIGPQAPGIRLLDARERESWRNWPELIEPARRLAHGIRALGVGRGERVALIYPTGWEFLEAFLACTLAGVVPTPLYPPVRLGRLDEYSQRTAVMLQACEARLVLCDSRVRRVLGHALAEAQPAFGARTLEELEESHSISVENQTGHHHRYRPRSRDLALVQFSSGTTVDPKPVALSHAAIVAQVETLASFWPDRPGLVHSGVSWLPLYHDMGLIGCLLSALQRPATLTLIPPELFVARPAIWLRALSTYRATVSPAPNFAYSLAADRVTDEEMQGVDLSSWRVALDGAESVAPSVLRRFCERFAPYGFAEEALTPVYGLSEASLAVTFSSLQTPFVTTRFDRRQLAVSGRAVAAAEGREIVSVGRPLPGFAVQIRAEQAGEGGTEELVEEGVVGTVWVSGPSLMEGYLGRPEVTKRVLQHGWLNTGDTGFLFQGELYLTGRARDLLILHGKNHGPEEIEHPVSALPGVRTGCVVARSELLECESGERLWLFVERSRPRSGEPQPTDDELSRACAEVALKSLGVAPFRVILLDAGTLPRTSSGKLRRAETWRRYATGDLAAAPEPGVLGLVQRIVASEWVRHRSPRPELTSSPDRGGDGGAQEVPSDDRREE